MPPSDNPPAPLVGIIMGSKSDWPTMKAAADLLSQLDIPHESRVVSAHRTPDLMADYAKSAERRGLLCIIAGAGGAAHLPGMVAAHTLLPVIGVPVKSHALAGLDSLAVDRADARGHSGGNGADRGRACGGVGGGADRGPGAAGIRRRPAACRGMTALGRIESN